MTLKDLLKKKDNIKDEEPSRDIPDPIPDPASEPQFTFMRSDSNTQEVFDPPALGGVAPKPTVKDRPPHPETSPPSKRHSRLRKSSNASTASAPSSEKSEKRLSQRLSFRSHSRNNSNSSVNIPSDLPSINDGSDENDGEEKEAKWEKRATLLAKGNPQGGVTILGPETAGLDENRVSVGDGRRSRSRSASVSDKKGDENIQEAIRLHEAGDLENSTAMFGRLADPEGSNNALSQVLFGLALRHGWGCAPDPPRAIKYLSAAASNSAAIEELALGAGMKKGGAAKGELVLAIYELANCFRNGWGVERDPIAAKQYYETAANLGDIDAMNEVARCYEDGVGTKKDKAAAAKYYRLAEENGVKTIGNSWIWKDKYNPKKP